MITTILFDLDGTLLPMDQDIFIQHYLGLMAEKLAPYGYDAKLLVKAVWSGTGAMVRNDGNEANIDVFWRVFEEILGKEARRDEPIFEEYYRTDFQKIRSVCGFDPQAPQTVAGIKAMGYRVALATNPLFPAIATLSRIRWAGLDPEDFELVTTYENSCHCKPNPAYYQDVLNTLGVKAEECVMVGNDMDEDMVAGQLGMKVFLLTDCLINKSGTDIDRYPHGSFPELMDFIRNLK